MLFFQLKITQTTIDGAMSLYRPMNGLYFAVQREFSYHSKVEELIGPLLRPPQPSLAFILHNEPTIGVFKES